MGALDPKVIAEGGAELVRGYAGRAHHDEVDHRHQLVSYPHSSSSAPNASAHSAWCSGERSRFQRPIEASELSLVRWKDWAFGRTLRAAARIVLAPASTPTYSSTERSVAAGSVIRSS